MGARLTLRLSVGLGAVGLRLSVSLRGAIRLVFGVALLVVLHLQRAELLAVTQKLANQKALGIDRASLLNDQDAQQAVRDDEQYDQDREE